MDWISAKNRLPDTDKCGDTFSYLITDGKEIGIGWYEPMETISWDEFYASTWHDDTRFLSKNIYGFPQVTHWMKLPNLPE